MTWAASAPVWPLVSCGGESALTSSATRSRPVQCADELEAFADGQAAPRRA